MKRPVLIIALIYILLIILFRPLIDKPIKPFKERKLSLIGIVNSEPVNNAKKTFFLFKTSKGEVRAAVPRSKLSYGDKIRVSGILSYSEAPKNPGLPERAYVSFRSFKEPKIISRGHVNPIKALAFFIRRNLLSSVQKILPEPYSDLLSGILFGKAAASVPQEIKDQFKRAGTVHILVVSGMHLSILIGTILVLLKSCRLPLWTSVIIASVFNLLYVLSAGAGASVIRAGIMAQAAMLGQVFDRDKDFFTTLSLAALFLLIINPLSLFEIGFQLSFAATISLVYLAPIIAETCHGMPLRSIISISIAPVLMTAPIILYNFSQISLVTIFANALIIPWISYLVILGFATSLIGTIFIPAARLVSFVLLLMLKLMHGIIGFFSGLPFACIYFTAPHFIFIVLYFVLIGFLIFKIQNGERIQISKNIGFASILIIVFLFVVNIAFASREQLLEMTVLDVGQGDAIYVQTPEGKKILIDGGASFEKSDMGKKIILPFLHRKGINELDLVVLSHPHDDHVGGLVSVLRDMKVEMVLDSGQIHTSPSYIRFLELIDNKKIKYVIARSGQVLKLDSHVKAYVLNPSEPLIEESALNNNSVVLRIVYGDISFLLMGDVEREGEARILPVQSNILKVGHHGSSSSSSNEFLDVVNPQIAIISCGKGNKFKHPHKPVLERLQDRGIKVYRTDLDGAVVIKTDGRKIFVKK